MTTKTEPGSASPGELPPEDEDRRRVGGLPSIIVDPAAYAAAAAVQRDDEQTSDTLQSENARGDDPEPGLRGDTADPEPASGADALDEAQSETQIAPSPATHGNGASAAHDASVPDGSHPVSPSTMSETAQHDADLPSEDRLTVEEAERFAESFRPSWHSLPALTASPLPSAAVPVQSAEESDPVDSVLPRSQRRRSLALVAGAVLVFAGLIAMAMNSAHTPEPGAKAKPSLAAKAPVAAPEPAKAPPPPPAPAVVAQPTLAAPTPTEPAPTEPTPTEATAVPAAQPELAQPAGTAVPAVQPEQAPAAPAAAPVATAVPAAQPEPVAPVAAPTVPSEPTTVRIQLQTTPESATLLIDGATVGNPYDQTLPKSGKHRVRVEAPGYRESEITLNFDRDRDLSVRLQKLRGRAARRVAPAASAPAPRPAAPAAPPPPVLSIKPAAPEKRAPAKAAPAKTSPKGAGFVSESPY